MEILQINSNVNEAYRTLITNKDLNTKYAKLQREYLKNNLAPTSLDIEEAAKEALLEMYFDGDFKD